MKLYQHIVEEYNPRCYTPIPDAWITRFTLLHFCGRHEHAEAWLVWLPSYGMEYDYSMRFQPRLTWGQRGFTWNVRTSEWRWIFRPCETGRI